MMLSQKLRVAQSLSAGAVLLSAILLNAGAHAQTSSNEDLPIAKTAESIWTQEITPSPGPSSILLSLSADSEDDIWSVGDFVSMRFNGQKWTAFPLVVFPGHGSSEETMNAVAAVSATDVWAVGATLENLSSTSNGDFVGVIERFNGTKWSLFKTVPGVELLAVKAISENDIFAVGDINGTSQNPIPWIEHFDGTSWSPVSLPASAGVLRGIAAISADDIWAVGDSGGVAPTNTLALHFDGHRWSQVAVPVPLNGKVHNLSLGHGLTAISTGDVWAVGAFQGLLSGNQQTLTEHWDGKAWKIVPSADSTSVGSQNSLNGVFAVSSKDVWACGQILDQNLGFINLIEHFDGTKWTISPVAPGNGFGGLNAMQAFPDGSVFAAGSNIDTNSFDLVSVVFHTNQGK
jgi:hypothetical protein